MLYSVVTSTVVWLWISCAVVYDAV